MSSSVITLRVVEVDARMCVDMPHLNNVSFIKCNACSALVVNTSWSRL
jgi:hypothetical protein